MKKTILTTFAVSAVMLLSTATAFAATGSNTNQVQVQQVTSVKAVSSEITGTIEKISDNLMTVKTNDGVTYSVPLGEFSKLDGFKDLALDTGTEVSLKSEPAQLTVVPSKALTPEDIENIKTDQKENTITLTPAYAADSDSKATITKIRALTPEEINKFKADNANTVTGKAVQTTGSDNIITLGNKEGNLFFPATEITANGKIVKLYN